MIILFLPGIFREFDTATSCIKEVQGCKDGQQTSFVNFEKQRKAGCLSKMLHPLKDIRGEEYKLKVRQKFIYNHVFQITMLATGS